MELADLGEFKTSGDQNTLDVLKVDFAGVRGEANRAPVVEHGQFAGEHDIVTIKGVPAGKKDSVGQNHISTAVILQKNGGGADLHHFSNVERTRDIIADGDELYTVERLTVVLVVLGIAVGFGLCYAVEGEVGNDAFVSMFGGVVCDDVGRAAQ